MSEGRFFCEKFRCEMSVSTCIARRRENKLGPHTVNGGKMSATVRFPGCAGCAQGAALMGEAVENDPSPGIFSRNRKMKPQPLIAADTNPVLSEPKPGLHPDAERDRVEARAQTIHERIAANGGKQYEQGKCCNCGRPAPVSIHTGLDSRCEKYARGTRDEEREKKLAEARKIFGPETWSMKRVFTKPPAKKSKKLVVSPNRKTRIEIWFEVPAATAAEALAAIKKFEFPAPLKGARLQEIR